MTAPKRGPSHSPSARPRVQPSQSYQTIWLIVVVALFGAVFGMLPNAPLARAQPPPASRQMPVTQNIPGSPAARTSSVRQSPSVFTDSTNDAPSQGARPLSAPVANAALAVPAPVMLGQDSSLDRHLASDDNVLGAAPVLSIVKSDGGVTTTPGSTLVYTLTYSNTGTIGATGVRITDTVPANTTFISDTSAPGWSCTPNNNAGSVCVFKVGTLAVGSSASLTYTLIVSSPLLAGANPISNTARIGDDSGVTSSSSDTTPITGTAPNLIITKSDNGVTATPNSIITYTLLYGNIGNIGASNVLISDTVPANTTFAGPTATWSCNVGDGAGTFCQRNIGVLASSGVGALSFAVQVNSWYSTTTMVITNTASISDDGANGADTNPNNNLDFVVTPLSHAAALTITKAANVSVASPGSIVTYTLRYTNTGTADATNVVLTDTVPVSMTFTGSGWTCAPNNNAGGSCTRSVSTLAAGGSGSAQFVATVASPLPSTVTQITNTGMIGDDSSHTATSAITLPTSAPSPSASIAFLPMIVRAPAPPTPTPTLTRTPTATFTPTPYQWSIVEPTGMVSDPTRDRLWLVSHGDNTVIVFTESTITSTTPTMLAKIAVGTQPFGIGMVDDKIYTTNSGGSGTSSVSVVNAATMTKIKDIALPLSTCGGQAAHLAVITSTHRIYVAMHSNPGRVAVIDSSADSLVTCVPVETGAFGIAAHPASNSIFVGSRDGLKLQRIDGATNNVTLTSASWNGSGSPFYIGVNPTTNRLFAMVGIPDHDVPNRLYVYSIDGSGNLSNVANSPVVVGNTGEGGFVVQSQCSENLVIAETADNDVRSLTSDLSSYSLVTEASGLVGHGPFGLLENPTLKRVYVTNKSANTLSVLSECQGPLAPRAMQVVPPLPTASVTPSPRTPTLTSTPTAKPASTSTPSPVGTPARTASPTSTATFVPTPTLRATDTPTFAATPTLRATDTLTATSTIPPTK